MATVRKILLSLPPLREGKTAAAKTVQKQRICLSIIRTSPHTNTSTSEKFTALDILAYSHRHAKNISVRSFQTCSIVFR
jgi:hypothetical protein